MADIGIKFYTGTKDKLENLSISDGQLIFVYDTREIYLDVNGERTTYSQIITLVDDEQRESLIPVPGFYFVLSTNILWRYADQWIQLTGSPQEVVIFTEELPDIGVENTLYVKDTKIYKYDEGNCIELGASTWESF